MSDDPRADLRGLHEAYLRLRKMIPGAFDTPHGPTPEQVWSTTEAALAKLVEKSKTNFERVGDFHAKFGLATTKAPWPAALLDTETFLFRYDFLMEELLEMLKAHREGNIANFADAIGDLLYVAYGTAHLAGIPIDDVFAEIQRANMQKERATGSDDSRSKRKSALDVVKPAGWQPPDIEGVLRRHKRGE